MTDQSLSLKLTPSAKKVKVEYLLGTPGLVAGDSLCRLPIVVGIPGTPLDAARLTITDADGVVPVVEEDELPTPSYTCRRWKADRATVGDVRVSYVARVRHVDADTPNGPLFDLRAEDAGVSGAGVTFLALPDTKHEYDVTLDWDLSGMPPEARGVSSHGEGRVRTTATVEQLAFAFYLAGPIGSYPSDTTGRSSLYWLSEPAFDTVAIAKRIEQIYDVMCDFFGEPDPGHRVFVRKHPYDGNGGTALHRSFVFGYSDSSLPTVGETTSLLAHETAHNWPLLDGEHGETAWYSEGTAEYYSILLPYRAGLITTSEYLALMNERGEAYYTNPLQTLTNAEAAEQFWADKRAQRVPYGRGLFYLVDLNAKLRDATGRSVDDLVLAVMERQRSGETVGVAEWIELVTAELGESGRADFEALRNGSWIIPDPGALGPRFDREESVIGTTPSVRWVEAG